MNDSLTQFKEAMLDAGLEPPEEIIPDGKLRRFGKSKNGWYVLHDDNIPAGAYGNWKTGLSDTWRENKEYSAEEKAAYKQRMDFIIKQREAEQQKRQAETKKLCNEKWNKNSTAINHAYLDKKQVQPYGLKQDSNSILVPIRKNKELIGIQSILPDGRKQFNKGGGIAGGYHVIGKPTDIILIGEGYATLASGYEATGFCSVIAFNAGNLKAVAKTIRSMFPDNKIIILADNDQFTEGNPGITKAKEAAKAIGTYMAIPQFKDLSNKPTDFNDLHCMEGLEVVKQQIISALDNEQKSTKPKESKSKSTSISLYDDEDKKKSQSTLLIEIGEQGILFHDVSMDAYSEIIRNGINITMKIKSKEYTEFLSHKLYLLTEKGANATAITDAKNTLEAKAKFDGVCADSAVRAFNSRNIYIDTGCDQRRVIEITSSGWGFTDNAPVKFVRKKGMTALPEPSNKGDLNLLKKYINILDSEFPLIIGWMLCALGAVKPYPILILQGEQGTGKSVTTRLLRSLIDPSSVPLRTPPKDTHNLLVSAGNTHIVAIDNLSGLNAEISDCLCRLSTGGGIDVRALYTDDEQNLVDIQRPVMINGIDDIANRPDLSERSIILNLPVISDKKRRREQEFWKEFDIDKPVIFAGLLDGLVSGLQNYDDVVLAEKPRMADVAHWVTACERGLGIEGAFIGAHKSNQQKAVESGIESSPIGSAIQELMANHRHWSGTPTELFTKLESIAGERQIRSRAWPQSTKGLNNIIKRLMPSFRKIGIEITKNDTNNREYKIESVGIYPPDPPIRLQKEDSQAVKAVKAVNSQDFLNGDEKEEFRF